MGWGLGREEDITGAFGVPGESGSGRRGVEFCTERGLYN